MTGNCPALNDRRWSIRREAIIFTFGKFPLSIYTVTVKSELYLIIFF